MREWKAIKGGEDEEMDLEVKAAVVAHNNTPEFSNPLMPNI